MRDIIYKLFRKRTDNLFLQFFRYIFVGGTSFLIDFSIYLFLINFLSLNYLLSAAVAFFISVLANYYLSTTWVFNQDDIENRIVEFNLFILISLIGLVFTEILLYVFIGMFDINYIWSKVISSILVLFWNFSARRIMFYGR